MFSIPSGNDLLIILMIFGFAVIGYVYGYYKGRYSSETLNAIAGDTLDKLMEDGYLRHHKFLNKKTGKYDSVILKYDEVSDEDPDCRCHMKDEVI